CRDLVDRVLLRGGEQLAEVLLRLAQPALLQTDFTQHQAGSMHTVARNRQRLQELLPLEGQPSSLLWPTRPNLARDDDQNAGATPTHRRLRRETERSPGQSNRQGNFSLPTSHFGMTRKGFAQPSPRFGTLIGTLCYLQWLFDKCHRGRRAAIQR